MPTDKPGWGGTRAGAGRKPFPEPRRDFQINIRVEREMRDWYRSTGTSVYDVLRRHYEQETAAEK